MERKRATMAGVGEKDFLRSVLPSLPVDHRFLNGFGHDASVLDLGAADVALVLKIDRSPAPIATRHGWAGAAVWARFGLHRGDE